MEETKDLNLQTTVTNNKKPVTAKKTVTAKKSTKDKSAASKKPLKKTSSDKSSSKKQVKKGDSKSTNDVKKPIPNKQLEKKENEDQKKDTLSLDNGYTPVLIDEQKIDHVAILKKKMEAQKKLNEKGLDDVPQTKPIPKISFDNLDDDAKEEDFVIENKNLAQELEKLREENKELLNKINLLTDDNNVKDERIIYLTNSITENKINEENTLELESLRSENAKLKESIRIRKEIKEEKEKQNDVLEDDEASALEKISSDVREKGELLIRIRVLNECISEKEKALEEVESDLDKLSEKDIVAEAFTSQIKEIRKERKDSINFANNDLESLASLVKQAETKMIAKREAYSEKCKELEEFEQSYAEKHLNFTEKENVLKIKSKIIAEKDSLYVDVEGLEVSYRKLVNRYKNRLIQAEDRMKLLNEAEANLINKYLEELKEAKIKQNEDYLLTKEEKDALLLELEQLSSKLIVEKSEYKFDDFDINTLTMQYSLVLSKINLANEKLKERKNIEYVLLKNEEVIQKYYDAFKKREIAILNINENKQRLASLKDDEMANEKKMRLEILVEDDEEKVDYYSKIINDTAKNEKTIYYIKLINSISELEVALNELKHKEEVLKEKIDSLKEQE